MSTMGSQITSLTIVYSTVYSRCRSKKTSKLHVTGLLCREFTGDWWIPCKKGQYCGKFFHLMMSSCNIGIRNPNSIHEMDPLLVIASNDILISATIQVSLKILLMRFGSHIYIYIQIYGANSRRVKMVIIKHPPTPALLSTRESDYAHNQLIIDFTIEPIDWVHEYGTLKYASWQG